MKENEKFQKSMAFSVAQMPHAENEYVAVVEMSVFDGQVMHKDIGVASAKSAKSNKGDVRPQKQVKSDVELTSIRAKGRI